MPTVVFFEHRTTFPAKRQLLLSDNPSIFSPWLIDTLVIVKLVSDLALQRKLTRMYFVTVEHRKTFLK